MSDDEEDLLDSLELFHFAVRIIGDESNFLDIFKTGLARLLKPRVARHLASQPDGFTGLTQSSFIQSKQYNELQANITNQLKSIIEQIKQEKLWISQGTGGQYSDPVDLVSKVLECPSYGVDQLLIFRSVVIEKLTFMPELILYYIGLMRACMSTDYFTRCYAYSLFRAAPALLDPRHYFNVLKEANKIWESATATFEFAAALYIFLNSLSDLIHNVIEDDLQDLLYGLVESIPKSKNFSKLVIFDPALRWITKSLPSQYMKNVLDASIDLLKQNSYAHICLILRAISRGFADINIILPALEASLPNIHEWPKSIQREAKILLSVLVSRLPQTIVNSILDMIADAFMKDSESKTAIHVFSDFLIVHYFKTSAPYHEKLYTSFLRILNRDQISSDLDKIFAAICANPVRFLHVVYNTEQKQFFQRISLYHMSNLTLYQVLFAKSSTILLSSNGLKERVGQFITQTEICDDADDITRTLKHINLCISIALHPKETFQSLMTQCILTSDENLKFQIIQIICVITLMGKDPMILKEIEKNLQFPRFQCEYTHMLNAIRKRLNIQPSPFEQLKSKIPQDCIEMTNVSSPLLTQLALYFQYIIWSESGFNVIFQRTRIVSTEWFALTASSLFTTIFDDPVSILGNILPQLLETSSLYIVYIGLIIIKNGKDVWFDALSDENFDDICQLMLWPQAKAQLTEEDISYCHSIHEKYLPIFEQIQNITCLSLSK